ncbi:ROK family protein,MarR family regulator [Corynebacterium kutscheri]|uniref:ROK family protein,MarR family regulator n=1 Tax=Corynebacterium kutscheri TaxID=35755 RepID=A0A0F6QXZ8_9CORY|nr:ROK family protein [Corynebacterium kutscheri]AKE40297.1 ROK family protein,MarR family regulator [Corynebacterium kutscheri]VEH10689.1 ROK-family transcriptional regulator [Corynebacterium kutscheri]
MSQLSGQLAFRRPSSPAAVCLHLIRHHQPVSRAFLMEHSHKSQPTITRAITALLTAELIQERPDLATTQGPGRPTIPVEFSQTPWVQIGVAIGTKSTYIGAYTTRGQVIREHMMDLTVAKISPTEFINHLVTAINSIVTIIGRPLSSLGVSTSGEVTPEGIVTADNLGWDQFNLAARIRQHINVPITVSSVVSAIAGAEQQLQTPSRSHRVLIFYVDDSVGAAVTGRYGVETVIFDQLDTLGDTAVKLANEVNPNIIVFAGSAFASSTDAQAISQALKRTQHRNIELRVIPTHKDNARAAARAVGMDRLIYDPLSMAKRMSVLTDPLE